MPGKVYCFNCYGETLHQINVNGRSAGGAAGWASSGSGIYTPASLAVPRVRHSDGQQSAVFPNDMPTALRFEWDSYVVQTSIDLSRLPNVSLDDDLIVHIALNQVTLMTARGFVLTSIPHNPSIGG